jgi:hypothetical protein
MEVDACSLKSKYSTRFREMAYRGSKGRTHFEYYHRPFIDLEGETGHARGPQP